MQTLTYNEWSMQKEILRRVRQEDEVHHARRPHQPLPIVNTTIPSWKRKSNATAFHVFLNQFRP